MRPHLHRVDAQEVGLPHLEADDPERQALGAVVKEEQVLSTCGPRRCWHRKPEPAVVDDIANLLMGDGVLVADRVKRSMPGQILSYIIPDWTHAQEPYGTAQETLYPNHFLTLEAARPLQAICRGRRCVPIQKVLCDRQINGAAAF